VNLLQVDSLKNKIGYHFKDQSLLELSLTHKSSSKTNNERLEFLGDAILNFYITKTIFNKFENLLEGKLTQIRSTLVSRQFLNGLGEELGLSDYVILGKGESTVNNSILGNTLEAIIGAIYLDSGLQETELFLTKLYSVTLENIKPERATLDSKSFLQEKLHKSKINPPLYEINDLGPSHGDIRFEAICRIEDLGLFAKGVGKNRKKAEKEAASLMLQMYFNNDD